MPELAERLRLHIAVVAAAESAQSRSASTSTDGGDRDERRFLDDEALHDAFPAYRILERIHYGGQGVVYKALQLATKRTVALKLLLDGPLATARQRARFEREVELVARLDHPNIVTVYDSGIVRGRHYVAMEFVDGLSIDDYAVFHGLSVRDIAELFRDVSHAVSAAHQKGVIHRDLKPSNILVDAEGRPHVLDFGLAKDLRDHADAATTGLSLAGQVIGTLPFLSPEQARGATHEVDVRSDIYALGVILYELLTNQPPYPVEGGTVEVLTNIIQRDPIRLRDAIDDDPERSGVARHDIDEDLERIVLKCLEKQPSDRYQSAAALADDLACYLRGEAVAARAQSGFYQLKKRLRRYRVQLAVLAAFAVVSAAALIVTTALWHKADRAARIAQAGLQMGSYIKLASVERDAGRIDQAIAMFQKAIEASELIDTRDKYVERHRVDASFRLAELLIDRRRLEEAEPHVRRAVEGVESLVQRYPNEIEWTRLSGFVHRLRGRLAYVAEDWDAASEAFSSAIQIREQLLELAPDNVSLKSDLATVQGQLGNVFRRTNDLDAAEEQYLGAYPFTASFPLIIS